MNNRDLCIYMTMWRYTPKTIRIYLNVTKPSVVGPFPSAFYFDVKATTINTAKKMLVKYLGHKDLKWVLQQHVQLFNKRSDIDFFTVGLAPEDVGMVLGLGKTLDKAIQDGTTTLGHVIHHIKTWNGVLYTAQMFK